MNVYMYLCITTVNSERSHEFVKEQGGVCKRVWKGKGGRINDVTIL